MLFRSTERNQENPPYNYSYTMTSYNPENDVAVGMSSIQDGSTFYLFKSANINGPAGKIMLGEEQTSNQAPQYGKECSEIGGSIVNDGRFMAGEGDSLTSRHSKKGDVTFADGHVTGVTWAFGTNLNNSRP